MDVSAPVIDYQGLAPLIAVAGGATLALLLGLVRNSTVQRYWVPAVAVVSLLVAGDLSIRLWGEQHALIEDAMRVNDLSISMYLLFCISGITTILIGFRQTFIRQCGSGEFHALLLSSIAGMFVLASSQNLITLFIGLELLSIPLYVLCASEVRKQSSLESGFKYLVIGSVGSATLLYGFAFIYGATGSTDFGPISKALFGSSALIEDPLLLIGIALSMAGLAFKASVAPFHMWTPDVYQGAPTPVTAFMAVATKAAAFAIFLSFFYEALPALATSWQDALAILAVVSIAVGNIGAIRQDSMKRMLGYSGVAQAGYMLAGIVVATQLGAQALVFYLAIYTVMNLGAFAVIAARESETSFGDSIQALSGIGRSRPLLATVMTICMLSLAGFPATAGFIGKFYLIQASVEGDYTWLAVAIVVGTMISLVYYLRVVAEMWLSEETQVAISDAEAMPAMAGGSPQADEKTLETSAPLPTSIQFALPAAVLGLTTVFFGIIPEPLVKLAEHAADSIASLL